MRRLFVAAVSVMIASGSMADVSFRWLSTASATAIDQSGVSLPVGTAVLLYVSTDAVVDFAAAGSTLQSTYGNDTFVGVASTGISGRYTTANQTLGASGSGAGSFVGLYTYMVLVNQAAASITSPTDVNLNTAQIAVSSMSPTTLTQFDTTPPGSAQSFTDASNSNGAGQIMQTQLVPEPSTVALMLAGLGIVAMRMRRK
jgi:hypothetical protein